MYALLDQKQSEVADLCRRSGVRRLDIFGSAVRADFDPVMPLKHGPRSLFRWPGAAIRSDHEQGGFGCAASWRA